MQDSRLNPIIEYAAEYGVPIMQKSAVDFLTFQTEMLNPKNILEIGTAIGYSGSLMLLHSSAHLTTIEIDSRSYEVAKKNFATLELSSRVTQILGDANESISQTCEKFDLIFLDYAKGQYIKLLPELISRLNIGGVLIADNVLFRGLVSLEDKNKRMKTIVKRMQQFLESIMNDCRLRSVIIPFCDGISLSLKLSE